MRVQLRRPCIGQYMEAQPHLNAHMRSILIDWLVEVAQEYALLPDTLHLACSLIDRYLGSPRGERVAHTRLQLVGVSALLVASKYEEVRAPAVGELCFITDNTYNKDEVSDSASRPPRRAQKKKRTLPEFKDEV